MTLVLVSVPLMAQTTPSDGGYAAGKADGDRDGKGSALWILGGCILSCLGVLIAYLVKPSPPVASLIGKSSDYVSGYTEAYKAKGAGNNALWAGVGCLLTGIPSCIWTIVSWGTIVAALTSLINGGGGS